MAVRVFAGQNPRSNKLVFKGKIYSVDKTWTEGKPDVTFQGKETKQSKTAHKTVLSQASPVFTAWFKEQWKQDKSSGEYPLPGDIDWEVFTNIISILYGEEVEFEEEALPDLFRAADYLQLDTLKVAILVSLTEEWEVKNSEVVGAMLTAAASEADPKLHNGLLALVSKNYFIRHIHTVVNTPTVDISALPYDTVKEIAQSEEVTAPEIELYHFMKKWAGAKENDLTVKKMKDLFSHVRYATIPHDDLKTLPNHHDNLTSALTTFPELPPRNEADTKTFTTRKRQKSVLLVNSPDQKRWTKRACIDKKTTVSYRRSNESYYSCSSIVSSETNGGLVVSLHINLLKVLNKTEAYIICKVSSMTKNPTTYRQGELQVEAVTSKGDIQNGITIRPTATGIEMTALDSSTVVPTPFDCPHPWLLTIQCPTPFTVQAM